MRLHCLQLQTAARHLENDLKQKVPQHRTLVDCIKGFDK